jgi:hypothetical protein
LQSSSVSSAGVGFSAVLYHLSANLFINLELTYFIFNLPFTLYLDRSGTDFSRSDLVN